MHSHKGSRREGDCKGHLCAQCKVSEGLDPLQSSAFGDGNPFRSFCQEAKPQNSLVTVPAGVRLARESKEGGLMASLRAAAYRSHATGAKQWLYGSNGLHQTGPKGTGPS